MSVAALEKLPRAQKRVFVPNTVDLGDWSQVEPMFKQLIELAGSIENVKDLEDWVLIGGELGAALDEEVAKRYINMTCDTASKDSKKAYLHFIETIEPGAKPYWHKLKELFVASPFAKKLPLKRWMVFKRGVDMEIKLFREANIPLQVQDAKLSQKYQELSGAMTVVFEGKEQTLQQLGRYMEETDRGLRQRAFEAIAARRAKDRGAIEDIFDEMIKLRTQIARNAGFKNYRDFAFKAKHRFDYAPADCAQFHKAVAELVVPLARAQQQRRKKLLGVETLRPWDLSVDVLNRTPLKPFSTVDTLVSKCQRIFKKIDPALAKDYAILRTKKLLDLESRKGKAPGGYQYTLEEARLPFIFMNAVGLHRDVETMLHEAGHAFHALAARQEPLLYYRSAPLEFCEVASMSMELLSGPHLTEFYSQADANRARRTHLENIIGLMPWIAVIDAFQHWIYTHPEHSRDERKSEWLRLHKKFGGVEDWSGYEDTRAHMWQRQGHLFGSPFYYIEYGIAQLGALQMWLNSLKNVKHAVANYRNALALGGSRPLPELFKAAKIKFDFGPKTVAPLTKAITKELATLEE
jgi:oligoendopeptidase F